MLSARVTRSSLAMASHCLRRGVTVKWFDNVETVVLLSSNNCRGRERASERNRVRRGKRGKEY